MIQTEIKFVLNQDEGSYGASFFGLKWYTIAPPHRYNFSPALTQFPEIAFGTFSLLQIHSVTKATCQSLEFFPRTDAHRLYLIGGYFQKSGRNFSPPDRQFNLSAFIIDPILVVASFMTALGLQATLLQGLTYRLRRVIHFSLLLSVCRVVVLGAIKKI